MSAPEPIQPQRREMEIIRVLFDRHLAERAVALAETRWPGSGRMVELAYEWPNLSPGERRQRLSELGPEQTHRLRALAALHPELQQAVDEMERRGVFEELQDAALDRVARDEPSSEPPGHGTQPSSESSARTTQTAEPPDTSEPVPAPPPESQQPELDAAAIAEEYDLDVEQLKVEMPELDLNLPSTTQFLSEQVERREEALKQAQTTMDRVRERLSQNADRIMSRSGSFADRTPMPRAAGSPSQVDQSTRLSAGVSAEDPGQAELPDPDAPSRMIEAPKSLTDQLKASRVVALVDAQEAPDDDEIVAIANELNVGIREFEIGPGMLRDVFGGLQRRGSSIETVAGPLPSALAEPQLVIVRGRIHPKIVERLRAGWADIPGTRATVKMHERARVLLVP